jgi:Tol biopolymer transport system component
MLPILVTLLAGGCGYQLNPHPTTAEIDSLSTAIQLTSGFTRAGEAYFSPDMKWIVFQATPAGQEHYQMYLAQLKMEMDQIVGTFPPIRISPEDSRNTCGFFSPDGRSLIFASTVGKEDPGLPTAGYQREGRDYRWSYPVGMEIYRADGWAGAISAAEPGKIVNLAQHALTNNLAYDAECSFSPDGKWIVYTSAHRGDLDLYAMRSDGTGIVQLTHTGGYDGGPFFSPDGQ